MTGKDIYINMQDIDEQFIIEATDIKVAKKKKFYLTERQRDNLVTAAIVCLVVTAVLLVPKIVKDVTGDNLNPAGVESTVASETITQDETVTAQETVGDLGIYYDNVPEGGKVIDGILYEYDTWLERYVVSNWSVSIGSGIVSETSGVGMSPILSYVISYNAMITESNANKMYYLVEISESSQSSDYSQTNEIKELYSVLTDLGDYGILLGEAGNYKSNYGDFYISHDEFIYGIMTYDEMKGLADRFAEKNPNNTLYYNLLSAFETDRANIYTDEGVPKYSADELGAEWKYVYSNMYDKYVVSKNRLQNGTYYSDSYSVPTLEERIIYSKKLKTIMESNEIINTDNAGIMAYLVEINVYDVSAGSNDVENKILSAFGREVKGDKLKQEYERLKKICKYDIRLGEKYWGTGNNTTVLYGILTYDEMKSIPAMEGFGYAFQIVSETTFGPSGLIEESLYGKGYTVINTDSKTKTE